MAIDAVFVSDAGHHLYASDGSVETAEYAEIIAQIKALEAPKVRHHKADVVANPGQETLGLQSTLADEQSRLADSKVAEMNQRKLQQQISELEANASSQKFISNLAVIKTPQASIFQQDDDTSKVLFRADPEDEFEVINVKGNWAHVRLENGADGWVRGAQLQRP